MKYRADPKSGNRLSALGFGCMRFPRGIAIDYAKTEKLILEAIDGGVTYFDTAYMYPGSEEVLGKILDSSGKRDAIYIATKLAHGQCRTGEDVRKMFEEQLRRLRTGRIDYYLIHNLSEPSSWNRLAEIGVPDMVSRWKEEGKIGQIGFSFHGKQQDFIDLIDLYDWDFVQIQYNYCNENLQAGRKGLEYAASRGIPVMIMEPLLGGKLATGLPEAAARIFRMADPSRSPAAWALRWLWDQSAVTVVLSGMNDIEQLRENLRLADEAEAGALTESERAVYPAVMEEIGKIYRVRCTGCNYCMPCPRGVNIPGCFSAYNARYAMGFMTGVQQYLMSTGATREETYLASRCTQCKTCVSRCPQKILIPDELKKVSRNMETWWFKLFTAVMRKATNSLGK